MGPRLLVLMPIWHAGFEGRWCRLVQTLHRRNYAVTFGVLTDAMNARRELGLPGLPEAELLRAPLAGAGATPIRSLREAYRQLLKADVVIGGMGKGMDLVSGLVRRSGRPFIQCNDVGDQMMYAQGADLFAVPGAFFKAILVRTRGVPAERVVVTGDLRFDAFHDAGDDPGEGWRSFCERYALDAAKRLVIFCSGAAQRQDPWTQGVYQRIVALLRASGRYQPMIRLHPNDLAGRKRHYWFGRTPGPSARALYPEVPCVHRADLLSAMRWCAFFVAVESSTCLESSVYGKNCAVVNLHEWCLNDAYRASGGYFPRRRFGGFGLQRIVWDEQIRSLQAAGILRSGASIYRTEGGDLTEFAWVGADCHLDEFEAVLASSHPEMVDDAAQAWHARHYWNGNDGRAHERLADLVERVQDEPVLSAKLRRSRGRRLWQGMAYRRWELRYGASRLKHILVPS